MKKVKTAVIPVAGYGTRFLPYTKAIPKAMLPVVNRPAVEMLMYRPLVLTDNQEKYDVRVKAVGGGIVSQAGAIKHGISRALVKVNEEYRKVLRAEGLLTRDPRVKERKKYGRKRARKRFQFSKR